MTDTTSPLLSRDCAPRQHALSAADAAALLVQLPDWAIEDGKLRRSLRFANYYETMAYANALAYLTHSADHHPELTITYNTCLIAYDTHSVNGGRGGLSENDFICAAKAGLLYQTGPGQADA